jgi:uncharacterized protein (DUF433 family)
MKPLQKKTSATDYSDHRKIVVIRVIRCYLVPAWVRKIALDHVASNAYIYSNIGGVKMKFTRITVRHDQMGGVPCIRSLRIPVATVVGMVANRMASDEILAALPDLESEDIQEALLFAAEAVRERQLPVMEMA